MLASSLIGGFCACATLISVEICDGQCNGPMNHVDGFCVCMRVCKGAF